VSGNLFNKNSGEKRELFAKSAMICKEDLQEDYSSR
jgi:hypothetical protein